MTTEHRKVYLVRGGRFGEDEDYALENGLAIIGFRGFPSLANLGDYPAVSNLVTVAQPELKTRAAGNFSGQLWAFSIAMKEGDIVVLPRKLTSQIALGRVKGPYQYLKIGEEFRHVRPVEWILPDIPRTTFEQDLLYSFGALLTVCTITRNNAEVRVGAVLDGKPDPGAVMRDQRIGNQREIADDSETVPDSDLPQLAQDQIIARIQTRFAGHALARLVDAVLFAEGWETMVSPPGPDGGVDILAGRGSLGLDEPRLCVQVKSQGHPADVIVYRTLQGSMQTFGANQGLLMCWGGFTRSVLLESRHAHFSIRLWDSKDLLEAIYRNYERLPAEIQTELPLKQVWMLVSEEPEV